MSGLPARFEAVRLLLERRGLRVSACRHQGERRVLITSGSREQLDAIADAHTRIGPEHVARVLATGTHEQTAWLELESDAVTHLGTLLGGLSAREPRFTYAEAIAFNDFLMEVVEAGHLAGFYLGTLAWEDVLVGSKGELSLIGFGFPAEQRAPANAPGICRAPEVTLGRPATAASDVFVLHATLRAMLPYTRYPKSYTESFDSVGALAPALLALSGRALAPDPGSRAGSIAELRGMYRNIRTLVPGMPVADGASMRATFIEIMRPEEATDGPQLTVHVDMRWFERDSERVPMRRRRVLRRLLGALVEERLVAPGEPLSREALVRRVWPDERILPKAATTRLYVAVRSLRELGLRDVLLTHADGYLLAPSLEVRRVEHD